MGDKGTLAVAFVEKLREAYDIEKQLKKGLKKLEKAAHAPALRAAFAAHLEETRAHHASLEEAFGLLNTKARRRRCDGIAGILEEVKAITKTERDAATMDACLIAVAQCAEHYEIAAYGTLVAWARRLGKEDVTDLLIEILEQEKGADETLSMLAEDEGVNQAAVETEDDVETDGDDERSGQRPSTSPKRRITPKGNGNVLGRSAHQARKSRPSRSIER